MNEKIQTYIGIYELYDNYIVSTINEGIHLDSKYAPEILEICNGHMQQPFGWISNKVNSYSADPLILLDIIPNTPLIRSYCSVDYGRPERDYSVYVKPVVPDSFHVTSLENLEDAIDWTIRMVNSQN